MADAPVDYAAKLRSFLNLGDDAPISPVAQRIIDDYLSKPDVMDAELERIKYTIATMGADPAKNVHFLENCEVRHINDALFLTAAGAQLTFQATQQQALPFNNFFVNHDVSNQTVNYGYIDPSSSQFPNSIFVGMPWLIRFAGRAINAEPMTATQAQRDSYKEGIYYCMKAGAEESYHNYQLTHPEKSAQIAREEVEVYGADARNERMRQLVAAVQQGQEARTALSKKDPAEKDGDQFIGGIKYQLDALAEKFLAEGIRR